LTQHSLLELPLPTEVHKRFVAAAHVSLIEQKRIEAADTMPFEIYRQEYLAPRRLGGSTA
ncbi:MAG TPA: glutamate--cysteine ligase, partial [Rhizobacter sp.]|nr:glutamate--cysteine ligase [Rhizobacter sp.]